jgi:starch synthase
MFLMPSKFEPCGLNQLMSMRYGTPPIVRKTGGLADSVIDADEHPEAGTGFCFEDYSAIALLNAVQRAIAAFNDSARWRTIKRNGMARDSSWERAAKSYFEMYYDALRVPARKVG